MKRIIFSLALLLVGSLSFAKKGYKRVYAFGRYNKDWALVKTYSGTYGFLDRSGKAVVAPVYTKIRPFGEYAENVALVKSISDTYGFIDRNGREIIPAIYERKEIRHNFKAIYEKASIVKPFK